MIQKSLQLYELIVIPITSTFNQENPSCSIMYILISYAAAGFPSCLINFSHPFLMWPTDLILEMCPMCESIDFEL